MNEIAGNPAWRAVSYREVMELITAVVWFAVGLVLLIKGGDWFVDGASGIAKRAHIPELVIGATVVSIGTTLPEVMVSATSAVSGHSEIAYGNALGSIICNTALIAAVTIAVRPQSVDRGTFRLPVIFFFAAMIFYAVNAYAFGTFTRAAGIIMLIIFAAYIVIYTRQALRASAAAVPGACDAPETECAASDDAMPLWKEIVFLVAGAVFIAIGADLLVDNGTLIAEGLGVPESVIALTFVALGTSLPELVTAISSLMKGHGALSLGNIIGANLFNLVLVCGISITLSPFDVPCSKTIMGLNSSLVVDIPLAFLLMAFLTLPAIIRGKLYRWQGITLLACYAAFCIYQFAI